MATDLSTIQQTRTNKSRRVPSTSPETAINKCLSLKLENCSGFRELQFLTPGSLSGGPTPGQPFSNGSASRGCLHFFVPGTVTF